jgi:prepilin-type N-terminal cleavage/methylation domain-containing protein
MKNKRRAFTLTEIVVTVVIIGIIAAIATPVYLHQKTAAWKTAVVSDVNSSIHQMELASYGVDGDVSSLKAQSAADTSDDIGDLQSTAIASDGSSLTVGTTKIHTSAGNTILVEIGSKGYRISGSSAHVANWKYVYDSVTKSASWTGGTVVKPNVTPVVDPDTNDKRDPNLIYIPIIAVDEDVLKPMGSACINRPIDGQWSYYMTEWVVDSKDPTGLKSCIVVPGSSNTKYPFNIFASNIMNKDWSLSMSDVILSIMKSANTDYGAFLWGTKHQAENVKVLPLSDINTMMKAENVAIDPKNTIVLKIDDTSPICRTGDSTYSGNPTAKCIDKYRFVPYWVTLNSRFMY